MVGGLSPNEAWSVSGSCATCHVMHAMEGGTATPSGGPLSYLLRNTCLGCHQGSGAASAPSGTQAPLVYFPTSPDTGQLAGGNFYYSDSATTGSTASGTPSMHKGHNPIELTNHTDLAAPPGGGTTLKSYDDTDYVGNGGAGWAVDTLSCSGVYGCHGKHETNGMVGTHHNNVTGTNVDGSTASKSFRFLYGIKGWESTDYEYSGGDYNVYYGVTRANDTAPAATTAGRQTMSYLCAECHGLFHSGAGDDGISINGATYATTPWIRHPVDFEMPLNNVSKPEYDAYAHTTTVPVASSDVTDGTITVASASDRIVMCLSCHRAHASPEDAALRWKYTDMVLGTVGAGQGNGCFACHTAKDG